MTKRNLASRTLKTAKTWAKFFFRLLRDAFFRVQLKRASLGWKGSEDKINVLCIVPSMVLGGAEKVVLNIAKSADRSKFQFHLITTLPTRNVWKGKFQEHFKHVIVPAPAALRDDRLVHYLHAAVGRLKAGIILISNSSAAYKVLPFLKARHEGVKVVDLVHAVEAIRGVKGLVCGTVHVDKRVCISRQARDHLVSYYHRTGWRQSYHEKLAVIPNGTDLGEYNPEAVPSGKFRAEYHIPAQEHIIAFVGRLSEEKNPLLFVNIAAAVISKVPEGCGVRFVMAGDGPVYEAVKREIERRKMDQHFLLTGMIDDVPALLKDTSILLITSTCEGIPLVLSEAMSMGAAVISTDVGGIRELIQDGVNGYLIQPADDVTGAFTRRILELLLQTGRRREMVERGRGTIADGYSLALMGQRYGRLFQELSAKVELERTRKADAHGGVIYEAWRV